MAASLYSYSPSAASEPPASVVSAASSVPAAGVSAWFSADSAGAERAELPDHPARIPETIAALNKILNNFFFIPLPPLFLFGTLIVKREGKKIHG